MMSILADGKHVLLILRLAKRNRTRASQSGKYITDAGATGKAFFGSLGRETPRFRVDGYATTAEHGALWR
jgi:hypothetical protein